MKVEDILKTALKESPSIFTSCEQIRLNKKKGDWDNKYFIDKEHMLEAIYKSPDKNPFFKKGDIDEYELLLSHVAVLVPWRYTKGIYEFDKTVYDSLLTTDIDINIPFDVFDRLPQWSLYIKFPEPMDFKHKLKSYRGMDIEQLNIEGFFVSINTAKEHREIIFIINAGVITMHLQYYYEFGTVREMIDKASLPTESKEQDEFQDYVFRSIVPIMLQLTMYLCSQEPDIDLNGESRLTNGSLVKTKKGMRLMPASKYTTYKVGSNVGKLIREAISLGIGSAKSPHIRKAHWHSYWTGKQEEKVKILKWLYPMVITGNKEVEL